MDAWTNGNGLMNEVVKKWDEPSSELERRLKKVTLDNPMPVVFRLHNDATQPQKLTLLAWELPDAPGIVNYAECLTSFEIVDIVTSRPVTLVDGSSYANSLRNMMGFRSEIQYSQAGKNPNSLIIKS